MKILLTILILCFTFSSNAQNINIYSKWATKIEDNVLLILDITKTNSMGVTRIEIYKDNIYRIDSLGYKRRFNTTFIDLDSSMIWWSGALVPLHPSIEAELSLGMIEVLETNSRGVPQKIKFSGDLPDLSIYLEEEDSIIFTRMITTYEHEIEYNYYTRYGGEVSHTEYVGENGGFSMEIWDVGFQFIPVKLNKSFEKKLTSEVIKQINELRSRKETEGLNHDLVLDTASRENLNKWIIEAKKQHRLNTNPEFKYLTKLDSSVYLSLFDKFNIINYPFRCGENTTAIQLTSTKFSSKHEIKKYIYSHYHDFTEALFESWLRNSEMRQNIYNSGYRAVGNSLALFEAIKDDYYFDHEGKKISIKDKKAKYYYLIFSQTFSVFYN
jgi:hypothetical protein